MIYACDWSLSAKSVLLSLYNLQLTVTSNTTREVLFTLKVTRKSLSMIINTPSLLILMYRRNSRPIP